MKTVDSIAYINIIVNVEYLNLVKKLVAEGYLKTPNIIRAFERINRADFLPADLKGLVGVDEALPIGEGQTISQPLTVAFMLELLQPQSGDKILDIGFGSGWTTALLAECVKNICHCERGCNQPREAIPFYNRRRRLPGIVFAIERIPDLCKFGKKNIVKYNFIKKGVVKLFCADGSQGLAAEAPFDKILASASASAVPLAWQEQLKIGGRLVLPINNSIWLFIKKSSNKFEEQEFPGFAFVPLISDL